MTEKKQLTREEEADEIVRRLKTPPKPRAKKLEATWTYTALQDLSTMHGIDIEKEIMEALSDEIDKEILAELMKNVKST